MKLMPSCKDVHHMVIESQEQPLPLYKRVLMRLHLGICSHCTNFRKQIDFIRTAMRRMDSSDTGEK